MGSTADENFFTGDFTEQQAVYDGSSAPSSVNRTNAEFLKIGLLIKGIKGFASVF